MNKSVAIEEIIEFLGSEVLHVDGNPEGVVVTYPRSLEQVDAHTLDWINKRKKDKQLMAQNSPSRVIICDQTVEYTPELRDSGKVLIRVKNPRYIIAITIDEFFLKKLGEGIAKSAVISPKATIASSAFIGANCSIGECTVGKNTIINANVVLYDNVRIGDNCIIQSGVIIGTDGLGCERMDDGRLVKFPHIGGVLIGNNVEIGANCQVAKGALSDTIIKDGVKINGLCFIAHNCILEENVWITGSALIAGSVKVKKNANIFSGVITRDQITIGEGATIGMGSVVTKDVPDHQTWFGNPAKQKI